ncbi:protein kinase [Pseudomyxococcus flavus]
MLAKVRHPNVVRLLGHWQWPDRAPRFLVIIMEYVGGQRLDVWADLENPSAHAVLLRVRGVARALRALHQHRALHRDVKEANVLVRAEDGEAVLVDLGVGSHEGVSRITGGSLPPAPWRPAPAPLVPHLHQPRSWIGRLRGALLLSPRRPTQPCPQRRLGNPQPCRRLHPRRSALQRLRRVAHRESP